MTAENGRSLHVLVKGRVQGVGYRAFVERTASMLGLDGWVRNRRDGSVEVMAEGSADRIEALEHALRRGPTMARVDALEPLPTPISGTEVRVLGGRGFQIFPTV